MSDFPYEDIIGLSRPESPLRAKMPMADRAAQFSPFAALVGYDAVIKETARVTDTQAVLAEDARQQLDLKTQELIRALPHDPIVSVTWFRPDGRKSGGAYVEEVGRVKKIDSTFRIMQLDSGFTVSFNDIYDLDFEIEEE